MSVHLLDSTPTAPQKKASIQSHFEPMPVLSCKDLSVHLDGTPVLNNIDLSFQSAQWLSVVGPNGAGKSTLLKALAGLLNYQGEVHLKGRALEQWAPKIKAQQLSWMGQMSTYVDDLRVHDVVRLGRLPFQKSWSSLTAQDDLAVEEFMRLTGTWDLRDRLMATLSGGQVQRVLLARVFCTKSEVLLMDEPLLALDPPFQSQWINWVRALVAKGVTVITVLHDLNVAMLAHQMLILNKGKVQFLGETQNHELHKALEQVFEGRVSVVQATGGHSEFDRHRHHVILQP